MDLKLSSSKSNSLDDSSNSNQKVTCSQQSNKTENTSSERSGESDADSGIVAICSPVENVSTKPFCPSSNKSSYSNLENSSNSLIFHAKSNSCSQLEQPKNILSQSSATYAEQIDAQAILRQIYNQQYALSQKLKVSSDKLRLPEFVLNHRSSTNPSVNQQNQIPSGNNTANDFMNVTNSLSNLSAINCFCKEDQLNRPQFINPANLNKEFDSNSDAVIYENACVFKQNNEIFVQQCITKNSPLHSIEYSIRPDNLFSNGTLKKAKSSLNQYAVPVPSNCECTNCKIYLAQINSSQTLSSFNTIQKQAKNKLNLGENSIQDHVQDKQQFIDQHKQFKQEDLKQALLEAIRRKNLERQMLEEKEKEIKKTIQSKVHSTSAKKINTTCSDNNLLNKINNTNYCNLDPLDFNDSMINAFASVALIDNSLKEQTDKTNLVETWIDNVECLNKNCSQSNHLHTIHRSNLNHNLNHNNQFLYLDNCKKNSLLNTLKKSIKESNYQNLNSNIQIEFKNECKNFFNDDLNSENNSDSSSKSLSNLDNKNNHKKELSFLTQSCVITNLETKSDIEDDLITKSYNGGYCSKETKQVLDEINLHTKTYHKSFLHKFSQNFTKAFSKAFHFESSKQSSKESDSNNHNMYEKNIKLNLDNYCIIKKPSMTPIQKEVTLLKRSNDKKLSTNSMNNTSSHRKSQNSGSIKKRSSIHKKSNGISPLNVRLNSQTSNNRRFSQSNLFESNNKNDNFAKSSNSTSATRKTNPKTRIHNSNSSDKQSPTKIERSFDETDHSNNDTKCKKKFSKENSYIENNVTGELVEVNKDGSQVIELKRQPGQHFGFFVARGKVKNVNGVYVSRMKDENTQSMLSGLLEIGDEIIAINDVNVKNSSIIEVNYLMTNKSCIKLHVMPYIGSRK